MDRMLVNVWGVHFAGYMKSLKHAGSLGLALKEHCMGLLSLTLGKEEADLTSVLSGLEHIGESMSFSSRAGLTSLGFDTGHTQSAQNLDKNPGELSSRNRSWNLK